MYFIGALFCESDITSKGRAPAGGAENFPVNNHVPPSEANSMGRWFDDYLSGNDLLHLMGHRERMQRMFDEEAERQGMESGPAGVGWSPAVDIHDAGDSFILTAEIPGVEEADIDLEVVGEALVLSGERIPNTSEKVDCYHRVERPEGPFRRVFRLPDEVDPAGIRAEYRDGLLTVCLPKAFTESKKIIVTVE